MPARGPQLPLPLRFSCRHKLSRCSEDPSTTVFAVVAAVAPAGVATAASSSKTEGRAAAVVDAFEFKIRPGDGKLRSGVVFSSSTRRSTPAASSVGDGQRRLGDLRAARRAPGVTHHLCGRETGRNWRFARRSASAYNAELDEQYHYVTSVCRAHGRRACEPGPTNATRAWVRWDPRVPPTPIFGVTQDPRFWV